MKKYQLLLAMFWGIVLLGGGQPLFAQKDDRKAEKAQEVKERIDSGRFTIDVVRALPSGGAAVTLTSLYSLRISGDSVYSHLPYYGRAYSIPYGGGKGLVFDAPTTDYTLTYDRKGTAKLSFRAKTDEDLYTFTVNVFPNGSSTISVTPVNRQAISYHGEMAVKE